MRERILSLSNEERKLFNSLSPNKLTDHREAEISSSRREFVENLVADVKQKSDQDILELDSTLPLKAKLSSRPC